MSSSIVLVCAVLAALSMGVLIAYAICVAMFSVFRAHALQVRAQKQVGATLRATPS